MSNPLEHAEHIAHAGHEGHGDHGGGGGHGGHEHEAHSKLGTYIGITMAVLGVILAYCAAKVGAERTELIHALVEQQHAHAKYQAQDVKHRVAVNNLRQMHATIPSSELADRLEADLKKIDAEAAPAAASPAPAVKPAAATDAPKPEAAPASVAATTRAARALARALVEMVTPSKTDAALLADTVDRYEKETEAANVWVESFNPAIRAHTEAQERYELAQLLAEIGIVVASVGLLIKRRAPWILAIALGVAALGYVVTTYTSTSHEVQEAEAKIEELGKSYRDMRTADKTTAADEALVVDIRKWAGVSAPAKAPAAGHHAPEHEPAKEGH
jgi:hypothetical protein